MENARRAERAETMISEYKRRYDKGEPTETAIVDLVADLKHLVRVLAGAKDPNGFLKWMELTESSHRHFIAEVYGV